MVDEKQLSGTSVAYEKLLLRNSENLRRTAETKIEEVAEKGIDADSSKVRGVSPRTPRAETRPAVASFSKKEVQEEPQKLLLNSEDLKIDKVLGSGGFGAVYRGTYLGQEVAIKKLHLIDGQVSSEQVAEFKKEADLAEVHGLDLLVSKVAMCRTNTASSAAAGDELIGFGIAALSSFFNGSFPVCQRIPRGPALDPVVFNGLVCVGVFLSSLFVPLIFNLNFVFTLPGALGGVLFVFAALFSFVAIPRAGLATAQAVWSCSAILVSFAWGAIGPAEVAAPVGNIPDKAAGISSALAVGLFGGSVLVPFKYIPPDVAGLAAIPSFGIGALVAGVIVTFGYVKGILKSSSFPALRGDQVAAGLASGLLWNAGNVASVIAQSPPFLLPYGVAYPILQCALVFGGLWGIYVFKEIVGNAVGVFWAGPA
ncbi:unnamed protein product [Durusdinium trenchii]|uniref:Protein kinase domain-containing protein n=1 Tax=Durusdinium trenchii TaxID=1381693 RepID=A0ABP0JRQ6_9DINO